MAVGKHNGLANSEIGYLNDKLSYYQNQTIIVKSSS